MTQKQKQKLNRRLFTASALSLGAGLALPALGQDIPEATPVAPNPSPEKPKIAHRNISSFRSLDWEPYFETLKNGAILVDITSKVVHFWSEDNAVYKLYPTSVPESEELTRRGRTRIIRKVVGPSWAPTASMKERNPDWPDYIGPGPDNPLGTHALYLTWRYYRIHGTHDVKKIGRRSSSGCVGLFNEHIEELYGLTKLDTQVLVI